MNASVRSNVAGWSSGSVATWKTPGWTEYSRFLELQVWWLERERDLHATLCGELRRIWEREDHSRNGARPTV